MFGLERLLYKKIGSLKPASILLLVYYSVLGVGSGDLRSMVCAQPWMPWILATRAVRALSI